VNVKLVDRVLATNVYVDRKNQPHSAPFLLRYESQIGSFLEGPTVTRSQEVRVEPTVLFVAPLATTDPDSDIPDLIPFVQEMAPPINPFNLMGKTARGSPSEAGKGKGKGKGAGKKGKKPISQAIEPELTTPSLVDPEPPRPLPVVHELDDSDQGEGLVFKRKMARSESTSMPTQETSPQFEAWVPDLMYGDGPISAKDTLLDNSEIEISAKEAHEADMKMWDSMHFGQIFRHLFRGLMLVSVLPIFYYIISSFLSLYLFCFCVQAAQGVHCMEARVFKMTKTLQTKDVEHEKNMAEVLESAASNYKALEEEHFKNLNIMKKAEE
jgi:hypothetical protein